MRFPFRSILVTSPFDGLRNHVEKVRECSWAFQQAIECYISDKCEEFDVLREVVNKLESDADSIKRGIRGHLPKGTRMPVTEYQLFSYLKEQDRVLDAAQDSLNWLSYRATRIPEAMEKEIFLLVDAVIEPIEELSRMIAEAKEYFESYSEKQRRIVKSIIHNIKQQEHEADAREGELKVKIFSIEKDPVSIFHLVGLAEKIGSVADHAENAGDMMRAMIAKRRWTLLRES
jgi:predicted phosphate transport protein (TIGR00153 family)